MTMKPRRKNAAVIGSGFGGLGAAIRLQSAGIQTVLYEARDLPGGRAYGTMTKDTRSMLGRQLLLHHTLLQICSNSQTNVSKIMSN